MLRALASRLSRESRTSFGDPVEPDVLTAAARGRGAGRAEPAPPRVRPRRLDDVRPVAAPVGVPSSTRRGEQHGVTAAEQRPVGHDVSTSLPTRAARSRRVGPSRPGLGVHARAELGVGDRAGRGRPGRASPGRAAEQRDGEPGRSGGVVTTASSGGRRRTSPSTRTDTRAPASGTPAAGHARDHHGSPAASRGPDGGVVAEVADLEDLGRARRRRPRCAPDLLRPDRERTAPARAARAAARRRGRRRPGRRRRPCRAARRVARRSAATARGRPQVDVGGRRDLEEAAARASRRPGRRATAPRPGRG